MFLNKKITLLFLCLALSSLSLCAIEVQIVNLKTEYATSPLGLDVISPRFSWQMESQRHGASQTAYLLTVTDETGLVVWNSGKIRSDISLNIKYQGEPLRARTRYDWKVTVWDQEKKTYIAQSWFETGLMNPDPKLSGWNGAKWIGGGDRDMILYSPYLPAFKLKYSIRLDEKKGSTKAAFVYGANDSRLMDKNKNLYHLENKRDSSFISIELDISSLKAQDSAQINIFRVGYHPDDKTSIPFKRFSIPTSIINDKNKYDSHTIYLSSVFGYTHIYIDGERPDNLIGEINLNPLGQGGDFITFPVLGDIGFSVYEGQRAYYSNIEIRNSRNPSNVIFSENLQTHQGIFCNNENVRMKDAMYSATGENRAVFATANPSENSIPMLRSSFSTQGKEIVKARLYATSRGIYEMYINGERIGNDYFNPGLTQYNKTHLYQTYDVTDYILPGRNAIGAILSEGWWSGGATFMDGFWNFFGDRQSLLSKLVITYSDGEEDIMVSDPSTWTYYNNGPITYSSFFQGEVYDASKDILIDKWSTASYNDSIWGKAEEVALEGNISEDERNKSSNMPMTHDYSDMSLIGQFGETVKKIKELSAVSVEEVRPGIFVYDIGQNIAGVPKINLTGIEPGKKITLRFAEVKYPDLPEYKDNVGMIMLENIRAAMAQDIYITKGGDEIINPRFTLHGYRFIEITGIEEALPLDAVRSEALSSIHELSSKYETSNPKVNKLWENITWSAYSNFISIPTDCPQRNERLGWGGDISVFSRTATYLTNASQFLRRHMLAMRDVQREDGRFPDIAPLGGGFGGILWGSAGITVAWESYQQYQDKELLSEHYGAMKNYIEYLILQIDAETNILGGKYRKDWGSLGDWLSPEHNRNEKTLLWEAYFIYDLELMNKMALLLGEKKDSERFEKLYTERKDFFNKTYIDKESGRTISIDSESRIVDTQASYALPLAFNIVNEQYKEKFTNNFVSSIKRENIADNGTLCPPHSLMTGFIGTAWINKALSDYGYTDVAYRLLQQTDYPSWLYSVEQGATTIWERLDSYTHKNGFGGNNRMNSFNHYSFGAVCSWMYNYSLGIERDEKHPGFKHFILKPEPDPTGKMTYAKGYYDSMYGKIVSEWEATENGYVYNFVIPANTSVLVYLPASSRKMITVNKRKLADNSNTKYIGSENGKEVFSLLSGKYSIEVKK